MVCKCQAGKSHAVLRQAKRKVQIQLLELLTNLIECVEMGLGSIVKKTKEESRPGASEGLKYRPEGEDESERPPPAGEGARRRRRAERSLRMLRWR